MKVVEVSIHCEFGELPQQSPDDPAFVAESWAFLKHDWEYAACGASRQGLRRESLKEVLRLCLETSECSVSLGLKCVGSGFDGNLEVVRDQEWTS